MAQRKECSPGLNTVPGFDPKPQESQLGHGSALL